MLFFPQMIQSPFLKIPHRYVATVLLSLLLLGCRIRANNNANLSNLSTNEFAWFLVDTQTELPEAAIIHVCIVDPNPSQKLPNGETKISMIRDAMDAAFNTWLKYIDDHEVEISEQNYPMPLRFRFPRFPFLTASCQNPDITVLVGNVPHEFQNLVQHDDGQYASATMLDPAKDTLWHKGVIWIAEHNDHPEKISDPPKVTINYSGNRVLEWIFLHEFGHIFGNPHIPGTVMDAQLLDAAMKDQYIFTPLRDEAILEVDPGPYRSLPIDLVRDLIICRHCYNKDHVLEGIDANLMPSTIAVHPFQDTETHDKNYIIKNVDLNRLFFKHDATIEQGAEIFRRQTLADEERIYHTAERYISYEQQDHSVTTILERNWGDLHYPGFNFSIGCENLAVSVFSKTIPEFARRFWEVFRSDASAVYDSKGYGLDHFGKIADCIDRKTHSRSQAKLIACKKAAQELVATRPIPKWEGFTSLTTTKLKQAMFDSLKENAFGGCTVLNAGINPMNFCVFKLGSVPFFYIWNDSTSELVRLEENFQYRKKTPLGYSLILNGFGDFIINLKLQNYRFELEVGSETPPDGSEKHRLVSLGYFTEVQDPGDGCSNSVAIQPLISSPLELKHDEMNASP